MTAISIIGSGFGLYGYLPALVAAGKTPVLLPARYQDRFAQRPELAPFAKDIEWQPDETTALRQATGVVLALSPELQCQRLAECLQYENIQFLLLEKPLANCPQAAAAWQARLMASGKTFRIAYLFRYLEWADELRLFCQATCSGRITIRWHFLAHHNRFAVETWKRQHSRGGGGLRFYGIHLLALLAELGYSTAKNSQTTGIKADEVNQWQATLCGENLPDCDIDFDCAATTNVFTVSADSPTGARLNVCWVDPFGDKADVIPGTVDRRVQTLSRFCQSVSDCQGLETVYGLTIQLWDAVELVDHRRTLTAAA